VSEADGGTTLIVRGARRVVAADGIVAPGSLVCAGGSITEITDTAPPEPAAGQNGDAAVRVVDATGLTVMPGFLDVHIHGGGGGDTMDATPDALQAILRMHAAHGTTGLLLTTMTQGRERIRVALACAASATRRGAEFCPEGAQVLGIHLEGPYISPLRPGAQPKEYVRDYDAEEFASWLRTAQGTLRLITLAPEAPGAAALMEACRQAGIVISLGHTDATAEGTAAAINSGATHATHLFNAMPSIHHREPGPIPVLLADPRVRCELIADGHHVAPEVVRMVLAAKGPEGVVLITDAMSGAGMPDGMYDLGGNPVTVKEGRATLENGALAGSVLTMAQAARNVRAWTDADWPTLARLTATNAADELGLTAKGRLAPGADADFVLVDEEMTVHATYVAGRCVYRR
jgi:N-acetylglucosamine-6-phosphate deacetylase